MAPFGSEIHGDVIFKILNAGYAMHMEETITESANLRFYDKTSTSDMDDVFVKLANLLCRTKMNYPSMLLFVG